VSFYTLSVRINGDVAPCCVDYAGGTNIGNLINTPLKELWQGSTMKEFWKMQLRGMNHNNPSCRYCDLFKNRYYARDKVDGIMID
jgi:radical SAM protein with 4Fe4S-binding SPASM domain